MIDEFNEWKRNCDRSSLALWTSAGILLAWDTVQSARRANPPGISVSSQWGLYLSAAAAAWTVNSRVGKSTRHVSTQMSRFDSQVRRLERRVGTPAEPGKVTVHHDRSYDLRALR